jgi:hypothetical protein
MERLEGNILFPKLAQRAAISPFESIPCAARTADFGRVPFATQLQAFCRSATEMEIVQPF